MKYVIKLNVNYPKASVIIARYYADNSGGDLSVRFDSVNDAIAFIRKDSHAVSIVMRITSGKGKNLVTNDF